MKNKILVGLVGLILGIGLVEAVDGPLTRAINLPVKTDTNGYLLAAAQTYTAPDSTPTTFNNIRLRTDANGYLIITNPTGFTTGNAPSSATFITQTPSTGLSAEQALSTLATGLLFNTTGTGILTSTLSPTLTSLIVNANTVSVTPPVNTIIQMLGVNASNARFTVDTFGGTAALTMRRADGTAASPTALQLDDRIGEFSAHGYGATGYSASGRAHLAFFAGATWTDTSQSTYITLDTTPVASIVPLERFRISTDGTLTLNKNIATFALLPVPLADVALHVNGVNTADVRIEIDSFAGQPFVAFRRANGIATALTALGNADTFGFITGQGFGSTVYSGSRSSIAFRTTQIWTDANQGSEIVFRTTPNGSTTVAIQLSIIGNGDLFVNNATHQLTHNGTPAVSNTSANSCGTTTATITGSNFSFKVVVGATSGTSCTVTFSSVWDRPPSCSVTNETTANLSRATSTTATVILAGVFVAGDTLAGVCIGH